MNMFLFLVIKSYLSLFVKRFSYNDSFFLPCLSHLMFDADLGIPPSWCAPNLPVIWNMRGIKSKLVEFINFSA
jgi:hypothetical protein